MTLAYPPQVYRRPSRQRMAQGDIAIAEFHQLRARSSERLGPGAQDSASPRLPYFGDPADYKIEVVLPTGRKEIRHLRVWSGWVMVLHQACELEFGDPEDSRIIIAPITSSALWPEASWSFLRTNKVPGFVYLPSLGEEEAAALGLESAWPESVVCLAGATQSSLNLIKPRRQLALAPETLPILQDSLTRFFSVRGFADAGAVEAAKGKRLIRVVETNQTVPGPSKLVKLYFGENTDEPDEQDDELTLASWGLRP
jgi:hypothetical protein